MIKIANIQRTLIWWPCEWGLKTSCSSCRINPCHEDHCSDHNNPAVFERTVRTKCQVAKDYSFAYEPYKFAPDWPQSLTKKTLSKARIPDSKIAIAWVPSQRLLYHTRGSGHHNSWQTSAHLLDLHLWRAWVSSYLNIPYHIVTLQFSTFWSYIRIPLLCALTHVQLSLASTNLLLNARCLLLLNST